MTDNKNNLTKEQIEDIKSKYMKKYVESGDPWKNSSIFSVLTLSFMSLAIKTINKIGVEQDMTFNLPDHYKCQNELKSFRITVNNLKQKFSNKIKESMFSDENKPNILFRAIFIELKFSIIISALLMFIHNIIDYCVIALVYYMVKSFNNTNVTTGDREILWTKFMILAGIRIFIKASRPIFGIANHFYVDNMICKKLHNVLKCLLFEKGLKKSVLRDKEFGAGEITNLLDGDVGEFGGIGWNVLEMCKIPFELTIGCVTLGFIIGWAIVPTLICIFIALFANKLIAKINIAIEKRYKKSSDKRLKTILNVYNNIRFIKTDVLENYFLDKLLSKNNKMLYFYKKKRVIQSLISVFHVIVRNSVLVICFGSFYYFGGELSIQNVYTIWSIFDRIFGTINHASNQISWASRIWVAANRLNNYVCSEEMDEDLIDNNISNFAILEDSSKNAIEIENGNFYWVNPEQTKYLEKKKLEEKLKEENEKKCCSWFKSNKKVEKKTKFEEAISSMTNITTSESTTEIFSENKLEISEKESQIKINLKDIDFKVKKGSCVAIIGKTGSGKSSLLNSVFNEMFMAESKGTNPSVKINGSVSYLPQNAKLMSKTIKDNILFFSDYDEVKYKDAIHYSSMTNDLNILLDRDQTMLGDKGINLSGGQKTRLGMARCLYADKDIVMLDDPISALDINVGKFVMENTVKGYLKDKTRIITTHAIAYLKYFDYIYIMDQGKIVKHGSYEFIKQTEEYQEIQNIILEESEKKEEEGNEDGMDKLIKTPSVSKSTTSNDSEKQKSCQSGDEDNKQDDAKTCSTLDSTDTTKLENKINLKDDQAEKIANIIDAEEKGENNFEFKTLQKFIELRGGVKFLLVQILFVCFFKVLQAKLAWFVQDWGTSAERSIYIFLITVTGINVLEALFRFVYGYVLALKTYDTSKKIFFDTNFSLIHASVNKFWDRVPVGRVINRLTSDSSEVDNNIPDIQNRAFERTGDSLRNIIITILSLSSWMTIFFASYLLMAKYYYTTWIVAVRKIEYLKKNLNTPKNQLIRETLDNLTQIRVFNKQDKILEQFYENTNKCRSAELMQFCTWCYYYLRTDVFSIIIVVPGMIFVIYLQPAVGMLALILTNMFEVSHALRDIISIKGDFEHGFVAFERMLTYMSVDSEHGYHNLGKVVESYNNKIPFKQEQKNWVKNGDLELKNLSVKYKENTPNVLKDISLKIKGGEKIGIVGRTGAGKTTLISAIYKTFENYDGDIKIDGKEIAQVDLQTLRSNITIIPQDPHLFNSSLKKNLDPFENFEDEQIIKILKEFGIWEKFNEEGLERKGLNFKIESEGGNLSQGEKQLVCMARALLNNTKLILLDEATANVDVITESKIQNAIKEYFKDSTILMIAHRLNTIMFCDKILVLEKGTVKEFGNLKQLKSNENSVFGKMVATSSDITSYMS